MRLFVSRRLAPSTRRTLSRRLAVCVSALSRFAQKGEACLWRGGNEGEREREKEKPADIRLSFFLFFLSLTHFVRRSSWSGRRV